MLVYACVIHSVRRPQQFCEAPVPSCPPPCIALRQSAPRPVQSATPQPEVSTYLPPAHLPPVCVPASMRHNSCGAGAAMPCLWSVMRAVQRPAPCVATVWRTRPRGIHFLTLALAASQCASFTAEASNNCCDASDPACAPSCVQKSGEARSVQTQTAGQGPEM